MKVLIACEESQAVCKEFRKLGHKAFSCDVQDCTGGHPEWHIKGDVLEIIEEHYLCGCGYRFGYDLGKYGCANCCGDRIGKLWEWDMMIAFPPCTYLSYAGNGYLNIDNYGEKAINRHNKRLDGFNFFMMLWNAPIKKICIENPKGYIMTYMKQSQIIQPYYFGDEQKKTTCLWLKNLPELLHSKEKTLFDVKTHASIPKPIYIDKSGKKRYFTDSISGKKKDTSLLRSKTFPGIAKAMAAQWK